MILEISRHILLDQSHSQLPNFIFHKENVILSQRITLDENRMKELLLFLERYSTVFVVDDLRVSAIDFEDIYLTYSEI